MWLLVFLHAEDGIRDLVRARGLGDVYKRQAKLLTGQTYQILSHAHAALVTSGTATLETALYQVCLLYTSDAADERSSVDLGGRRIIKKKTKKKRKTNKKKTTDKQLV